MSIYFEGDASAFDVAILVIRVRVTTLKRSAHIHLQAARESESSAMGINYPNGTSTSLFESSLFRHATLSYFSNFVPRKRQYPSCSLVASRYMYEYSPCEYCTPTYFATENSEGALHKCDTTGPMTLMSTIKNIVLYQQVQWSNSTV